MKKPVLVIMAAGMGSRYGGLKQIDPIDEQGHIIIDFSIYDAIRAGFEKLVFIIKKQDEADFMAVIGNRIAKQVEVAYVYQDLANIPEGFEVPDGRQKPWGTGHAILSCRDVVDGPFAVINADDYYGPAAMKMIYGYLCSHGDDALYRYAMVGYILENTLTENGHVARGVCTVNDEGELVEIHERTQIEKRDGGAAYTEDDGHTWISLPKGSTVSMNMWGFYPSIFNELDGAFRAFLKDTLASNPLKGEFFLPTMIEQLLKEHKAAVKVLKSTDRWYGVTYREDKPVVMEAIRRLKADGLYPEKLWEE